MKARIARGITVVSVLLVGAVTFAVLSSPKPEPKKQAFTGVKNLFKNSPGYWSADEQGELVWNGNPEYKPPKPDWALRPGYRLTSDTRLHWSKVGEGKQAVWGYSGIVVGVPETGYQRRKDSL